MSLAIVSSLGFGGDGHSVKGRVSISDLFPVSKNRCGIYLLQFSDNTFYLGQALDAVRRFAQHRKNYDTIVHHWFQPVSKAQLDEVEQRLIRKAEREGLLLTNKTFVTNVIGQTDLDLLIPPSAQEEWVANGLPLDNEGVDLAKSADEKFQVKYRQEFQVLSRKPAYSQIRALLRFYITLCLPAFRKTELSFWALSCLPSTNKGTYPRFFSLNINGMEAMVAGTEKVTERPFTFVVVTGAVFVSIAERKRFVLTYDCDVEASKYRAAGVDQLRIYFPSMVCLLNALKNEATLRHSIREMNLRLMRRGGTIFSPYHCFDLVRDVLK